MFNFVVVIRQLSVLSHKFADNRPYDDTLETTDNRKMITDK